MALRYIWVLALACSSFLILNSSGEPALASHEKGRLFPGVIPKTVVSSRLRLVYFVGVEGTGHHFFTKVFRTMFKKHHDLQYVEACNSSMESYNNSMEVMQQELRVLAGSEGHLPELGTIATVQRSHPLQLQNCRDIHQLSFPNKYGPEKAQAYPDLRTLAEMSEEEGVDVRFLYLQRSAWDLTVSNTNHRKFHTYLQGHNVIDDRPPEKQFLQYTHIILTNIAVVESMLQELGRGFIVCHKFNLIGDQVQAKAVSEFLAPSEEAAKYLESAILETGLAHDGEKEELLFEGADRIVARLQRKLDSFEAKYCDFTS